MYNNLMTLKRICIGLESCSVWLQHELLSDASFDSLIWNLPCHLIHFTTHWFIWEEWGVEYLWKIYISSDVWETICLRHLQESISLVCEKQSVTILIDTHYIYIYYSWSIPFIWGERVLWTKSHLENKDALFQQSDNSYSFTAVATWVIEESNS